ncbi:TPA: hypothetical protein N0F65_010009 [Lagenidium giganteum]|uniref:Rab-GAP TBC domain-containing protein n=1 Tax=Lagenidium giganteum TaxID=4803 RepID=A0AAV2ZI11_9STRA|nr:TPA: hypothetical protein N0F65_010009 [Lagenidium giganteum]
MPAAESNNADGARLPAACSPPPVHTPSSHPAQDVRSWLLSPPGSKDDDPTELGLDAIRHLMSSGIGHDDLAMRTRAMAWRILLGVLSTSKASWQRDMQTRRDEFTAWKREFLGKRQRRTAPTVADDEDNNNGGQTQVIPCASDDDQRDASLVKEIEKDVSRTQSALAFFAIGGIAQQWMLRILFVYAKRHPDIGYMQGMNEILAPLLLVFGSDPDEEWAQHAEADAFHAFETIMSSAKILYMRSPSDPSKSGVDRQMERLTTLIRQHDALLWQHLNSVGLTPDLYTFRWYMTLLAREFPMDVTLRVWDALLADPKRFSFVHYVCCALVRHQRHALLHEGFTACLNILQTLPNVDIEQVLTQAEQMREKDRLTDHNRQRAASFSMTRQ